MASRAMKIDPKKPASGEVYTEPGLPETLNETAIAARAYQLWQERGCPVGSPENDWLRAEEELKSNEYIHVTLL